MFGAEEDTKFTFCIWMQKGETKKNLILTRSTRSQFNQNLVTVIFCLLIGGSGHFAQRHYKTSLPPGNELWQQYFQVITDITRKPVLVNRNYWKPGLTT